MLVTMKEILDRASEKGYAVAAPNVDNELNARACIEAAETSPSGRFLIFISSVMNCGLWLASPVFRSRSIWIMEQIWNKSKKQSRRVLLP